MNSNSKGVTKIISHKKAHYCDTVYIYELREIDSKYVSSFEIVLYEIYVEEKTNKSVSFYRTGPLFSDLSTALRFFNFIKENLATPHNMPYVIEDFLTV